MRRDLGLDAVLVPGDRGAFDVAVDGALVFSKHTSGRFPQDAEIVEAIRARS